MLKKSIALLTFSLSLCAFANQSVNTNPSFNQAQNDAMLQAQNQSPSANFTPPADDAAANSNFAEDPQSSSSTANNVDKQNDTLFDVKTAHGSVIVKKNPPKTKVDTIKSPIADTQKMPNSKPPTQNQP